MKHTDHSFFIHYAFILIFSFSVNSQVDFQTSSINHSLGIPTEKCHVEKPTTIVEGVSYYIAEIKNCGLKSKKTKPAKPKKKIKKSSIKKIIDKMTNNAKNGSVVAVQCKIIAKDNFNSKAQRLVFTQDCIRAAKSGDDFAKEKYKGHSNNFNCGRHGYWQSYVSCLYSRNIAKQVGDLREALSGSFKCSIKADSKRDLFNNNVARTFGHKFLKNYKRDVKGCNSYARLVASLMVSQNKCAQVQKDPETKLFNILKPVNSK